METAKHASLSKETPESCNDSVLLPIKSPLSDITQPVDCHLALGKDLYRHWKKIPREADRVKDEVSAFVHRVELTTTR
jgi:hypothetical protein